MDTVTVRDTDTQTRTHTQTHRHADTQTHRTSDRALMVSSAGTRRWSVITRSPRLLAVIGRGLDGNQPVHQDDAAS
eukprot:4439955-Alexandrium_andersonii.AAC.1